MTSQAPPADLVDVPGGTFRMGSDDHYPEEAPAHERRVAAFRIQRTPVTNAQFAAFVDATSYVTIAERPIDDPQLAHLSPEERAPGSLVFTPTAGPVRLDDWRQWWRWVPGANWRQPAGPGSSIEAKAEHPVVHIAYPDAMAYAEWAGLRLPSEAEWELAARGGPEGPGIGRPYAWGEEFAPGGRLHANTWQGRFPYENTGAEGWVGTSPVGSFPANRLGAVDLIGNVWEWTSTEYTPSHAPHAGMTAAEAAETSGSGHVASCCGAPAPTGFVTKGGSHLCAPEYCRRYRPAARSSQDTTSSTSHLGFRCAADAG